MENAKCRYDIQGLADELEVELKDIVKLYSNYFEEMKSEISEMHDLYSKKDWVMLERVIHNVKGVSANVDINDVFSEASAFDTLLKINVTDSAAYYIDKLETLIKNAEEEVSAYFSAYDLTL